MSSIKDLVEDTWQPLVSCQFLNINGDYKWDLIGHGFLDDRVNLIDRSKDQFY
ncbi:unnamed protein product, partial [Dovyalis caffra]